MVSIGKMYEYGMIHSQVLKHIGMRSPHAAVMLVKGDLIIMEAEVNPRRIASGKEAVQFILRTYEDQWYMQRDNLLRIVGLYEDTHAHV
jgi:hypothetical protein